MDPITPVDLEAKFVPAHGGVFMGRFGSAGRSAVYSMKKVCVVATDKSFLVALLYEWSKRGDCYYVKYSASPRDGMYLGRCFLTSDEAAALLCREYKGHPKLMVAIQDDDSTRIAGRGVRNGSVLLVGAIQQRSPAAERGLRISRSPAPPHVRVSLARARRVSERPSGDARAQLNRDDAALWASQR